MRGKREGDGGKYYRSTLFMYENSTMKLIKTTIKEGRGEKRVNKE
jgi:peptide methionine sulfoxide reductase MsrA